ncbi:hypothetical protein G7048_03440 [Diaphorobacter sp. HDW4B]|uniref:hypothetical protein n=1 Tax=Diaphorobacter sp. HDW4B TaxID=2714925 RepID=UPI00140989F6|nr:hypothetical protein [Diaphorobacter sp. HDW4B]QIL69510.1 hypothetical protein G7048_03440 [Diaphorobacter sp. HDW4B]
MFKFSSYPSISFWEVTKNMLFPDARNTPLQEEEVKNRPDMEAKEDQQRNIHRDASLANNVT